MWSKCSRKDPPSLEPEDLTKNRTSRDTCKPVTFSSPSCLPEHSNVINNKSSLQTILFFWFQLHKHIPLSLWTLKQIELKCRENTKHPYRKPAMHLHVPCLPVPKSLNHRSCAGRTAYLKKVFCPRFQLSDVDKQHNQEFVTTIPRLP